MVMHARRSGLVTSSAREIMPSVEGARGSPAQRERPTSEGVSSRILSMSALETWTERPSVLIEPEDAMIDFNGE